MKYCADHNLKYEGPNCPREDPPSKEYCDRCNGVGWYEGGKTLQTLCEQCKGTGYKPPPKDEEAKALFEELQHRLEQVERLRAALQAFVAIDDADKSAKALLSNQGQGMDGYSKLANYEACIASARQALS